MLINEMNVRTKLNTRPWPNARDGKADHHSSTSVRRQPVFRSPSYPYKVFGGVGVCRGLQKGYVGQRAAPSVENRGTKSLLSLGLAL